MTPFRQENADEAICLTIGNNVAPLARRPERICLDAHKRIHAGAQKGFLHVVQAGDRGVGLPHEVRL